MTQQGRSTGFKLMVSGGIILAAGLILGWVIRSQLLGNRSRSILAWIRNPSGHPEWERQALTVCPPAPFAFPTTGYIGYLWGASFRPGHRHQRIDIFSPGGVGETPVYASYPGYLSRRSDWKSSLIIRVPDDPLHPGRQIWTYYTHLADADGRSLIMDSFPPGTNEVFVEQGTLLGTQGNFSGTPGSPVGIHLHFSIVKDDGRGSFKNELDIANTLDPTPYFGMPLNAASGEPPITNCLASSETAP